MSAYERMQIQNFRVIQFQQTSILRPRKGVRVIEDKAALEEPEEYIFTGDHTIIP